MSINNTNSFKPQLYAEYMNMSLLISIDSNLINFDSFVNNKI